MFMLNLQGLADLVGLIYSNLDLALQGFENLAGLYDLMTFDFTTSKTY